MAGLMKRSCAIKSPEGRKSLSQNILKACLAAALLFLCGSASANKHNCPLALVLAVDVSGSIDAYEYGIQMRGLADAFRSEDIVHAIELFGMSGIYVTAIHWSGDTQQFQIMPWTRLSSRAGVYAFAAELERRPRTFDHFATAIGEALGFANSLFLKLPALCHRRVIDVSGDGKSNEGWSPHLIRDAVVGGGVTINGLAILASDPKLKSYYQRRIIGGDRSFVMSADLFEDYPKSIRRKLLREIMPGPVATNEGRFEKTKQPVMAEDFDNNQSLSAAPSRALYQ